MFVAVAAAFTIIFLALHVAGRIDWSWWVVFSPMIVLGVLTLAGFVQGIVHYRAHAKAIQAQVDMLLTKYPGAEGANPYAALMEAFGKLGQGGGPPVA